jgi:O-antigen ligase
MSDFANINDALGRGQSIPTPVDHIKYSLFVAFATLSCFLLYWTDWFSNPRLKISNMVIGVFLFVFLHILAVRSGLAVFYLSLIVYLLINVFSKKLAFQKLLLMLTGILLIPFVALKTIPSLERKIGYMKYDIEMYLQGKGSSYSDSERIYSYKVGYGLFKSSPILGTGIGDLLNESELSYKDKFGLDLRKYPHNMYLFLLAGLGLIGFILCLIAFLYPSWYFRRNLDPFFLCFTVLVLISFIVENTIQRSYSTAFYLFFSLLGISYMNYKKKSLI